MATGLGIIGYILIRFILQDEIIGLYNQNELAEGAAEFLQLIKSIHKYDSLSILALAVNSAVLGVLYGYGSCEELKDAGADTIVETVKELSDFLNK